MQVVGFNLIKVKAERFPAPREKIVINTNIEFLNVEKQKSEIVETDLAALSFKFTISYDTSEKPGEQKAEKSEKAGKRHGEISFEGEIMISVKEDELKSFLKSWKKKEIPKEYTILLYNFILRKCSIRALQLEEEIGLPSHLPFPQVRPRSEQQ